MELGQRQILTEGFSFQSRISCMRLFFLMLLCFFSVCPTAKATEAKDIAYGTLAREVLDIYVPDNAHNAPVMVYVHGGGWQKGSKEYVQTKPQAFNKAGFVFVSISYPLVPEYTVESQALSVARAVTWVHKNITPYGGNPDAISLMGHSAGGHLVALVATDHSYFQKAGGRADMIKTLIHNDGAALNVPWRMTNLPEKARLNYMYHDAFGADKTRWERLSPYHHLERAEYTPRTLFLIAESRKASFLSAEKFASKMKEFGKPFTAVTIPGSTHFSINRAMGENGDPTFQEIMDFLSKTP